jgi:hypothetical protein
VAGDGLVISASDGSRQCGGGANPGDVLEGRSSEIEIGLERDARSPRDSLHLPEEGHEVIRRDARGGVICDPILVAYLEGASPEILYRPAHPLVSGDGEPGSRCESLGADLRVGKGYEWMQPGASGMARENLEAESAG